MLRCIPEWIPSSNKRTVVIVDIKEAHNLLQEAHETLFKTVVLLNPEMLAYDGRRWNEEAGDMLIGRKMTKVAQVIVSATLSMAVICLVRYVCAVCMGTLFVVSSLTYDIYVVLSSGSVSRRSCLQRSITRWSKHPCSRKILVGTVWLIQHGPMDILPIKQEFTAS